MPISPNALHQCGLLFDLSKLIIMLPEELQAKGVHAVPVGWKIWGVDLGLLTGTLVHRRDRYGGVVCRLAQHIGM